MSDLSDEELVRISTIVNHLSGSVTRLEMACMVVELQRRRAEQAAGREHVERVVREAYTDAHRAVACPQDWNMGKMVAVRVADRLGAPVLSADDVATLVGIRTSMYRSSDAVALPTMIALLDRLIAGAKP